MTSQASHQGRSSGSRGMGESKRKKGFGFSSEQIEIWENEKCLYFSIALSRITGWILQADFLTRSQDDNELYSNMIPLRFYVEDNIGNIFDVRGIKSIKEFSERTILPLFESYRDSLAVGVRTKFFDEANLISKSIVEHIDEDLVLKSISAITCNQNYLSQIPKRQHPCIPAYYAALFSFGKCACYAEALSYHTGLKVVGLCAVKFCDLYNATPITGDGYIHSFLLHEDGYAEDAWGIQSIDEMAKRFGLVSYKISIDAHKDVLANLKRNSGEQYDAAYNQALEHIKKFR